MGRLKFHFCVTMWRQLFNNKQYLLINTTLIFIFFSITVKRAINFVKTYCHNSVENFDKNCKERENMSRQTVLVKETWVVISLFNQIYKERLILSKTQIFVHNSNNTGNTATILFNRLALLSAKYDEFTRRARGSSSIFKVYWVVCYKIRKLDDNAYDVTARIILYFQHLPWCHDILQQSYSVINKHPGSAWCETPCFFFY